MIKNQNSKRYDLEDRTLKFSEDIRNLVKNIPRSISNLEDLKQLVRSSGSVGANYIEANESLSKKDFIHRIKICRKEAKESEYWLRLLDTGGNQDQEGNRKHLITEVTELRKIFGSIIIKSE